MTTQDKEAVEAVSPTVGACHKCGTMAVLIDVATTHIGFAMLCSMCFHIELDEPLRGEDMED